MSLPDKVMEASFIQPNGQDNPDERWHRIKSYDEETGWITCVGPATGQPIELQWEDVEDTACLYKIVKLL